MDKSNSMRCRLVQGKFLKFFYDLLDPVLKLVQNFLSMLHSRLFFAAFLLTMISSTIYELICLKKMRVFSKTLASFSMYSNTKTIFSLKSKSASEIRCINGIRALSVIWIVICHNYLITYWQAPLINGSSMIEVS